MSTFAHFVTGAVAVAAAIVVMAGWQHFHHAPMMAKVDIIGIVTSQQKSLAAQMKPGMDQKAQAEIIESASRFGKRLDVALTQVASECKCTIINSAAIIKDSPSTTYDYTKRVLELALSDK
ncbi:MAG: hypothetical protein KJ958_06470 [Gammaproteobacteria bacterium]|nr:hypothetical protein [Gammaproteobacteria bacterium]MBU1978800.1 hypothetical protein [Gammaproteobacteria bacterium]